MSGWILRARVRIVADTTAGNVVSDHRREYRAGEEVDMLLRGQSGKPLSEAAWWSSTDVDGAYILRADQVVVLEMKGSYWVTCGDCGAKGEIERNTADGLSYLDVGGRIARRQRATAAEPVIKD